MAKRPQSKRVKPNWEPKPIPAMTVRGFLFAASDDLDRARDLSHAVAMLTETLDQHEGLALQRVVHEIIVSQKRAAEQVDLLWKLAKRSEP